MEKVYLALCDWYENYIDDHEDGTQIIGVYAKAEDAKKAICNEAIDQEKNMIAFKLFKKLSVLENGWIIKVEDDQHGQYRYRVLEMTVN